MSRVAVVVTVAGVAALVAGCGGSGQASPPAVRRERASLVATGPARVCDGLRPVASGMVALKQAGFSERERYSRVLAGLGQRAYQGAHGNVTMANLLSEAATAMDQMAVSSHANFLTVARGEVRQAMELCPAPRTDHDRD